MADPVAPEQDESPADAVPARETPPALLVSPPRASSSGKTFGRRFLIVYLLLGLVLGVAIAGLVVVLGRPGHKDAPAWSVWEPAGDDAQKTQQIADHVGGTYRLPSGQQLVGIQATPPRVQDVPIGAIAVRHLPTEETPVNVMAPDGTVVYIMCGLGDNCSISEGEPSAERLRLLRREALELALYTFRYVDGKDSVVAFLPPAPGSDPSYALFFQRGPFEPELDKPLRTTLSAIIPPLPSDIAPSEVATIDRLTSPNFYRFTFQQLQDGTAVLVLDDPRLPQETNGDTQGGTTQDDGGATTGGADSGATTGSQTEADSQSQ